MNMKKERVLLGMSGGTDSSMAACLLQQQGYEVVGVTFRFFEKDGDTEYLEEAAGLCARLGIEHIRIYERAYPCSLYGMQQPVEMAFDG